MAKHSYKQTHKFYRIIYVYVYSASYNTLRLLILTGNLASSAKIAKKCPHKNWPHKLKWLLKLVQYHVFLCPTYPLWNIYRFNRSSFSDLLVPSLSEPSVPSLPGASMASLSKPDFIHDSSVVGYASLSLGLTLNLIPICSQTILHQPQAQSQALQESQLLRLGTSHLRAFSVQ